MKSSSSSSRFSTWYSVGALLCAFFLTICIFPSASGFSPGWIFDRFSGQLVDSDHEEDAAEMCPAVDEEQVFQIADLLTYPEGTPLIGSWNLRLKGPPAFMRPGDYRDPVFIARLILKSRTDLWAIQEIPIDYATAEGRPRNHYMDAIADALNRFDRERGGVWEYAVINSRDRWGQNPGFLWNTAFVRPLEEPRALEEIDRSTFPDTERRLWSRVPAYAPFIYTGHDVALLAFSVQQRGYNSEAIRHHRAAEAAALLALLPALREETGISQAVVLGRLTDSASEPSKEVWEAAGFTDLNGANVRNLMSGRGGPDDSIRLFASTTRIVASRGDETLFPSQAQTTLGDAWLAESEISLHNFLYYASNCLPVVTAVTLPAAPE